jgi:hypothetical protein
MQISVKRPEAAVKCATIEIMRQTSSSRIDCGLLTRDRELIMPRQALDTDSDAVAARKGTPCVRRVHVSSFCAGTVPDASQRGTPISVFSATHV